MSGIREKLRADLLFDQAIVAHGFAPCLRDYNLFADVLESAPGEEPTRLARWRFTHCPLAATATALSDRVWRESWDDGLTDATRAEAAESPGYVWGVRWANAYPGMEYVEDSPLAAEWSARLGRAMHEVRVETNVRELRLVFHDVSVTRVPDGAAPGS